MIEMPPAVITCPVLDCGWTHAVPEPDPRSRQQATLADVFGPGVYAAAAATQEAYALERVLDEHFRTHSTTDYVRTMAHQRAELEKATTAYEAHRATVGRLQLALADISDALDITVPLDDDLDDWTKRMRTAVRRLRRPERNYL